MTQEKKKLSLVVLFPEDEAQLGLRHTLRPTTMLAIEEGANDVMCQLGNLDGYKERTIVPHAFCPAITLNPHEESFRKTDDFGDAFTFVYAKELRALQIDYNPRHKAIQFYVDALPDYTRIVLYWHR